VIDGQPVYGGANDPRLGSIHDKSDPGYFGHLELAKPVILSSADWMHSMNYCGVRKNVTTVKVCNRNIPKRIFI
jgi:hypothetical protein